ncbi:MAG TPA: ferritin [Verrucomicrobia bacterium]|nr:MAG: ferritin [Lentisphaerae bacterium GWF2_57_35]HBA83947.1 ferritin [Verrucomicrobiota bacterium]
MISKKMESALNAQINKELYSAYLYLAMSADSADKGFPGMSHWFKKQYHEELEHAEKIFDYLIQQNARASLEAIEKPTASFNGPLDSFENALKHEKLVTASIYALVDLAQAEKDHASHSFLQWFVDEQVEEEANALDVVTKLKMIGDGNSGVVYLDGKLGKRGDD